MAQPGLIRCVVGVLMVFGAVGGMEQQPEADIVLQMAIAVAGLAVIYWAVHDLKKVVQ